MAARSGIFVIRSTVQEGDPSEWWAENFKSHHDSLPKGPQVQRFSCFLRGLRLAAADSAAGWGQRGWRNARILCASRGLNP